MILQRKKKKMHFGNNSNFRTKKKGVKKWPTYLSEKLIPRIFSKENKQEFKSTHRQAKVFYILRVEALSNRK